METIVTDPLNYYDDEYFHESIFYVWERGESRGDSVTPATFNTSYQQFMLRMITQALPKNGKIFSIGCGNATIEHQLKNRDFHVTAIDPHPIAVKIAAGKGIKVSNKSFSEINANDLQGADMIFADGVLGHLFEDDRNLTKFIEFLQPFRNRILLCSNDSPKTGTDFCRHPKVNGFWHLSVAYLAKIFSVAGFEILYADYFEYQRPLSGDWRRSIIMCKI